MPNIKQLLQRIRPWDRLGIPRKQYEAKRPWKTAELSRAQFEVVLVELSDEFIEDTKREAEADRLVGALFGDGSVE